MQVSFSSPVFVVACVVAQTFTLSPARHPRGASFVRPSKVSFGVDYLTAVQEVYGSDVQEAVNEASSNNVDLRLKEVRYVV